jgi:ATP-dependent protease ClpP protease subunit
MSAGIAIYSELLSYTMRGGGNHVVTTLIRGVAASAASLVLQAGDLRVGGPLDQLMIHEPNYTCEDQRLCDVKRSIARMEGYHEQFIDICMKRCKVPRAEFVNRIQGDWWMVSDEALEIGLIDAIG